MSHHSDQDKDSATHVEVGEVKFYKVDDLDYVEEKGGNGASASYQIATGAPIEVFNPLGYNVGFWTALMMNVGQTIGTGIFSTPSNILNGTGSVGLSLIYWVIGLLVTLAGVSVYLELASFFPSRSGGEVVYLEQAFHRPKYFFPITFAVYTILLSFNSSNSIVCAKYIFEVAGRKGSDWEQKGVALGVMTAVSLIVIFHTNLSLKLVNIAGTIKLLTLVFITLVGFVVLGGHTRVAEPTSNFKNAFEGTTNDAYSLSNALVSIIYSYQGYANVFNMVNEVKNPIPTIKRAAYSCTAVIFVLYFLTNIAYFAAVPKADIKTSSQITASLFFENVFGSKAAQGLTILPVISALGNVLAVVVGQTRMVREIGRQGVLPWPKFWITTKPFGSPIGSVLVIWALTVIMIVGPPAGSAFNFVVSLKNWPDSVFLALLAVGLIVLRRQRQKANLPRSEYRGWTFVVYFFILSKIYLLVMPFVPPKTGTKSPSFGFFYLTPIFVALGIVLAMVVYYILWTRVLPNAGGYQLRARVVEHEDGSVGTAFSKVPNDEVEAWDAKHDPAGRSLDERIGGV